MSTKLTPILLFLAILTHRAAHADPGAPPASVDLNQASSEQLQTVPGIGPSKAAKILEYRQKRPFRTVEELVRVKGFGRKTLVRLRPFLSVDGNATVANTKTEARPAITPRPAPPIRAELASCPVCQCICTTAPATTSSSTARASVH